MGEDWELKKNTPRKFAVLLYRQWEALDIMGPVEAINTLSRNTKENDFEMYIIAAESKDWDSVSTAPRDGPGSLVNQRVVPTHTYVYNKDDPSADMVSDTKRIPCADVLIIPGGIGPPETDELHERSGVVEFIKQYYKKHLEGHPDRYLFTVCTGSNLAAAAGCLHGVYATTNKSAWSYITNQKYAQDTYWVAKARWVGDDWHNIWTTSGVSAGTDGMLAWMERVYGQDKDMVYFSKKVADGMEWIAAQNHLNDPFAYDHKTGIPLDDHPGNTDTEEWAVKYGKRMKKPDWESS